MVKISNDSILVFGLILFLYFIPSLYEFAISHIYPPIDVNLCSSSSTGQNAVAAAELVKNQYTNVPDYFADIKFGTEKPRYQLNENVSLSFSIADRSISTLEKPYFYVLVYGPSGSLKRVFPCFGSQISSDFSPGYLSYYAGSTSPPSFSSFSKWKQWYSEGCSGSNFNIVIDNRASCIPRAALMSTNFEGRPIRLTFPADETGTWKAYIFLFDEQYKQRPNAGYPIMQSTNSIDQHAASASSYEFTVVNETQSPVNWGEFLKATVFAIFAIFGAYLTTIKQYARLKEYLKKHKRELIALAIIVIVLIIFFYFATKSVCIK